MHASKLVVAHRGYHARFHENTLDAMQAAIELGADMVEFDVRRCADGELIVHHDADIHGKPLAQMDYEQALQASAAWDYRIPRLRDLLKLASGNIGLDIELKEIGYEESVLREIFDFLRGDNFFITSFETAALSAIRALSPGIRLGILTSDVSAVRALEIFRETKSNFLAPESTILNEAVFREAERQTIPLLPWTIDDPGLIGRYLREDSVFGVITNNPAEALQIRGVEG